MSFNPLYRRDEVELWGRKTEYSAIDFGKSVAQWSIYLLLLEVFDMGGYGSGQWQSYDGKRLVEETMTLNIFKLYREGFIVPGAIRSGTFTCGTSSMGFILRSNLLSLQYRFSSGPHAGQDMQYAIQIVTTQPHYGGCRPWFLCPTCDRRAAKLYLAYGHLKYECRRCAGLAYESTRAGKRELWRIIHAQDRRLARLNALAIASMDAREAVQAFSTSTLGELRATRARLRYERKYGASG